MALTGSGARSGTHHEGWPDWQAPGKPPRTGEHDRGGGACPAYPWGTLPQLPDPPSPEQPAVYTVGRLCRLSIFHPRLAAVYLSFLALFLFLLLGFFLFSLLCSSDGRAALQRRNCRISVFPPG